MQPGWFNKLKLGPITDKEQVVQSYQAEVIYKEIERNCLARAKLIKFIS